MALLAPALVAGCGGDGGGGGASSASISKHELIERGDELCAEFLETEDRLEREYNEEPDPAEQARIAREVAALTEQLSNDLEALGRPEEGATVVERYVETSRERGALLRRFARKQQDGADAESVTLLNSSSELLDELEGIGRGYGFEVCGSPDA